MITTREVDDALREFRDHLATLHELAAIRDKLARAQVRRPEAFAEINARIAAQRALLRASRSKLALAMHTPPGAP